MKDQIKAEEITQDALIKFMLAAPELELEEHALSYLHRTIENLFTDLFPLEGRRSPNQTVSINSLQDARDSGGAELSARQLSILHGMVEGKTNHELANELGFSVSTVRHETMRIYESLSVSDRKEAAKKALVLGLI